MIIKWVTELTENLIRSYGPSPWKSKLTYKLTPKFCTVWGRRKKITEFLKPIHGPLTMDSLPRS